MTDYGHHVCFAVVVDGKIDLRTIAPHARGAVLKHIGGKHHNASDERVFKLWDQVRGDAEVLPVKVTVMRSVINQEEETDA